MAVFTKLFESDFTEILKKYNLGSFISFAGISEGIENTNYILEATNGRYILTIYEKRVSESDLPFFINLMRELSSNNFLCPQPIADKKGDFINKILGKNYTIVTMLNGRWQRSIGNNEVSKAAESLAKLHKATNKFPKDLFRKNSMAQDFWLATYQKVSEQTKNKFSNSFDFIGNAFELISHKWPQNLPSGIIHADYFPDNVLFENEDVSGVIDFYMSCNDFYAYDLAICLNSWCFEKDNSFNFTKAKILFKSYQKHKKLNDLEIESLPVLCVGASLRFLSTRLYDYFNRVEGAVVNTKDPSEYLEKLKFHLQIKSYKEYGL